MDEIHVHKTKKSICAHFAESPCSLYFFSRTLRELTHSLPNKTFISTTKNARTACFFAVLESTYFLKFF